MYYCVLFNLINRIMKKVKLLMALACVATVLYSCKNSVMKSQQSEEQKVVVIGGDADEHGCKTSAGYTWSEVRKDCIRLFEAGVKLNDSKNANATSVAYLVFSVDSLNAELFVPQQKGSVLLHRTEQAWENETYSAYRKGNKLVVEKSGVQLFAE